MKLPIFSLIFLSSTFSFSHTSENLAKDIQDFNKIPAAVAIVEHIFTLQDQQQTAAPSQQEILSESNDYAKSTYIINAQSQSFNVNADFGWGNKSRIWGWPVGPEIPFYTILQDFRLANLWGITDKINLGKFFTCKRVFRKVPPSCTSMPALTHELFAELRRQHNEKQNKKDKGNS